MVKFCKTPISNHSGQERTIKSFQYSNKMLSTKKVRLGFSSVRAQVISDIWQRYSD